MVIRQLRWRKGGGAKAARVQGDSGLDWGNLDERAPGSWAARRCTHSDSRQV